ncbi:hypothetical protein BO94DRAFT_193836 [Aspergillus sclerotioniger CBS 115572]|uniref:Uncharacterized protein n=1 Tax=Aspergillus sclerotioniger CBS 115572 TaxID=1450535 RepID=A0A317VS95_9EURO|nr:hypothetical protein BO94DRAFT_193836 [Aspergillus sclerotioniger CBS 115572]PWY77206.1 hypothetical protein BO94DRAFT_193836 [Aspergillus sclerotioniger CBS 115572]
MVALSVGLAKARRPSLTLLLLIIIIFVAQVSVAQDSTTDDSTTSTTTDAATTTESATTSSADSTTTSAATTTNTKSTSTGSSTSSSSTNGYPVVTVPPTADAPYMQKSKIPEGTLFIVVGAVLGAIGLAILAWRGIVAWSVNRSVRQAAMIRSSETKGLLRSKKRRSRSRRSSSGPGVTLDKLGENHHHRSHSHSRRHHRSSTKTPSSNSALFFSPTAGMHHNSNRRSSYLPAGYYNAGSAAPPRSQETRFSAADLPGMGPQSQGYTKAKSGPSPPESPRLSASANEQDISPRGARRSRVEEASTSTINLSSPPLGRTPSAYLEDLFDSHAPQNRH